MIKKIVLIFILIFSFLNLSNIFAETTIGNETGTNGGTAATKKGEGGLLGLVGGSIGGGSDDISSKDFEIDTSLFSIGGSSLKGGDSKTTINNTLGNIIKKLMIALGVISLFIMIIGAGYMIMYHGHDEYLSKGKNIFIGGITALIVALGSYYLVNLVGYILYS